jgi:hypothetical protein
MIIFKPITMKTDLVSGLTLKNLNSDLSRSEDKKTEEIVIYDECGDSLWEVVLRQEEKRSDDNQHPSA